MTQVKFYIDKEGETFAYFPTLEGDNKGNKTSYAHIGQHSACSPEYIKGLKCATAEQYKDLSHELKKQGYDDLQIMNDDDKTTVKTIDVTAKEWFDRTNGNSYFSAQITVNYGMKDAKIIHVPFQYGYENQYHYTCYEALKKEGYTPKECEVVYWRQYENDGIIYRSQKIDKCLKRDVIAWGAK